VTKKFENVDMCDPKTHDDPWEMLDYFREEEPLYWDPHNEVWYVFRYDDIVTVARDPEVFTSTEGNRPNLPPDPSMIHQDGDSHRKQRGLVAQGFSPKYIRSLEPKVRDFVDEFIGARLATGEMEVVAHLAAALPMRIIGVMLGVPTEKHTTVLHWIDKFLQGGQGPVYVDDDVNEAFGAFCEHHEEMIAERGESPEGDDLLSRWMRAELEGEKLNEEQLLFEHTLLNVGGAETTRSAIAGGLLELARNPEQFQYLADHVDDREVIENACEEIIRWVTPFHNMFRTATRDVEMHGKVIKAGQMVGMQYPAANRDPRHFPNAYTFDVKREWPTKHIAFGYGSHFCLGSSLARIELRVTLEQVLRQLQNLRVKPGTEPKWVSSSFVRGPKEAWMTFEAR
jgi:cytochrome P450 family 142 subfamily A polypeptide 1